MAVSDTITPALLNFEAAALREFAARIARGRANEYQAHEFEAAGNYLKACGAKFRDLAQLAYVKAELCYAHDSFTRGDNGNGHARIEAARITHCDARGYIWRGK